MSFKTNDVNNTEQCPDCENYKRDKEFCHGVKQSFYFGLNELG